MWDYIKDKVKTDEDGLVYITINGHKYSYGDINYMKSETLTLEGSGTVLNYNAIQI